MYREVLPIGRFSTRATRPSSRCASAAIRTQTFMTNSPRLSHPVAERMIAVAERADQFHTCAQLRSSYSWDATQSMTKKGLTTGMTTMLTRQCAASAQYLPSSVCRSSYSWTLECLCRHSVKARLTKEAAVNAALGRRSRRCHVHLLRMSSRERELRLAFRVTKRMKASVLQIFMTNTYRVCLGRTRRPTLVRPLV